MPASVCQFCEVGSLVLHSIPSAENVLMQAALTALTLRPQTREFLFQHVELRDLFLIQLRLPRLTVLTHHLTCNTVIHPTSLK